MEIQEKFFFVEWKNMRREWKVFLYAQKRDKKKFFSNYKEMIQIHVLRVLRMLELEFLPRLRWQMRSIKLLYESQKFYIITK